MPTIKAVPLREIYRIIAGHSNYHGDNILAAMTCITEGKEVKPIRTIEAAPVVHGKWIESGRISCRCSICNVITLGKGANFCPNCGAKMKGGAE